MSKVLKIAAVVVAVAAITVATGGLGTAPAIGGAAGSVTATAAATTALGTTIAGATVTMGAASLGAASILGLSAGALMAISSGLSLASGLMARPPSGAAGGIQTDWSADPQAGVPYAVGRTYTAGNIVHRVGYGGAENPYQTVVTVYSCAGPIESFNTIQADRAIMTFDGAGNAVGPFHDYMYFKTQLGAQPAGSALTGPFGAIPGWSAASKLSGMAASIWTGKFDTKGKVWPNGQELKMGVVGAWVKVYDPRKDSSYPGGSGAHRWNDETTWEWSDNPWLHGLTWAVGRHSNGKRTVGVGMPLDGIDVAAYVNAANVATANIWGCGGVVWSTDDKWDVMKRFAQAGGGEPVRAAATLSCFVNAPKVSLATITQADLADGQVSVTAMQSRRERINGVVPRYRSEAHDWEVVSGDPVRVAAYVAEDGEQRTKETDLILVQDARQGAQLAAYEVVNGREFGPIEIPLKPAWMVFKVGDCLTLDLPDVGLNGQPAIVINRKLDPGTGVFTLVMRSETTAKHDFALGRTAVAPPTPAISDRPGVPAAPGGGAWTLAGASLTNAGTSLPALELTGLSDNPAADAIIVEIRKAGATVWDAVGTLDAATTRKLISDGIASATAYEVAISYRVRGVVGEQLVLGPMTSGDMSGIAGPPGADGTLAWTPVFDPAHWARSAGTFTRLQYGFDTGNPVRSVEMLPGMSVSWTVLNTDKNQLLGLTDLSDSYTFYANGNTGHLFALQNALTGAGVALGDFGAYAVGDRLTVAHRGNAIVMSSNGLELQRVDGIDPASRWMVWGAAQEIGAGFGDVAATVTGADGDPGVDGVSPIQVDVLPSSVSIRGDAGGAAYPTLLPAVAQIVVRQGTTILTPTSVTIPSGGKVACDGTVSATTVTITSVSDADGSLSFDVVADGQTVRGRFDYAVVADGAPGATSASFTRSSPQVTSSSYVDYGAAMAINADGAGNLKLTFTGSVKAPDGGDLILQSKWQIQPAGGSRTDVAGSEKTSTQSQWVTDPDRQMSAQFGTSVYNLTGLTPGGAYLFYFMVRKTLPTWANSATCDFRALVERPS